MKSLRSRPQSGFTLVEVMVSLAAFSVVMAIAMSFLLSTSNFAKYSEGKLLVNRDIRKFTGELADYATFANYFIIYDSFSDREQRDEGASGDFLVLAFVDEDDSSAIAKLVGYYRSATASTEGPVRKFEIEFNPPSTAPLEDLLPAIAAECSHQEIIELSRGLSDGRLFYNFFNRSITVQGELIHQGSTTKQATNTYNFTVSPRG